MYRAEFGGSRSNRNRRIVGGPNWERWLLAPLVHETCLTLETRFYFTRVILANLVVLGQTVSGPDLRGTGGPGPRPPTNRRPPTKPVIFYLSFMLVVYKTDSLTHSLQNRSTLVRVVLGRPTTACSYPSHVFISDRHRVRCTTGLCS